MATASINATFGMNVAPLKQAFVQAQAIATAGGANVARAIQTASAKSSHALAGMTVPLRGINGPFGTGPVFAQSNAQLAARAQRNSAAGFLPAPPGKYPSPVQPPTGAG